MANENTPAIISDLTHDNRGVSKSPEGKTLFIRHALPGEEVHYRRLKKHRNYDEAIAETIITASPDRVAPRCPHYTLCSGCSGQHMNHDYQIKHKQQLLLQQLQHFGQVTPNEILPPLLGPQWQYRHKARLAVRYVTKKEKVLVGFREVNGRYIADLNQCEILHPTIGQRLPQLSQLIQKLSCYQHIAQIEVAVSDDEAALIFRHLKPLNEQDQQQLQQFAEQHQLLIYLQPKGPDSIHKLWPQDNQPLLSYALPDYKLQLQFHPSDFTQVNPSINRAMINQALQLLDPQPNDTILDLFCGLGNFTLPLATKAQQVIGIEDSETMVQRAQHNAKLNQLTNVNFYEANLFEPWQQHPWAQQQYDKILLDPPRSGAQEIVSHIEQLQTQRITYVSCNPATLARDAGILVNEKGYRLEKAGIMDMFPHTAHVESIALFIKN